MNISLEAITIKFEELQSLWEIKNNEWDVVINLREAKPVAPVNPDSDFAWNQYQSLLAAWIQEGTDANDVFLLARANQISKENEIIALLPPNQWVYLQALSEWTQGSASIGYATRATNVPKVDLNEYSPGFINIIVCLGTEAGNTFPSVVL
jgi:hypothetical protein